MIDEKVLIIGEKAYWKDILEVADKHRRFTPWFNATVIRNEESLNLHTRLQWILQDLIQADRVVAVGDFEEGSETYYLCEFAQALNKPVQKWPIGW